MRTEPAVSEPNDHNREDSQDQSEDLEIDKTEEMLNQFREGRHQFDLGENAPPVDRELLRRYVNRELSDADSRTVSEHVVRYEAWHEEYLELILNL